MGKDLNAIKNELNESPMYNLSLSSKELFHSNFLAWLGKNEKTRRFFVGMIKELTGIGLKSDGKWSVEREDKNFDLCIKEKDKYILVIENKVKSIPRKSQLDEYERKIKNNNGTKFLLLTLVKEFPHKDDIDIKNGGRWITKTYQDIAKIMENKTSLVGDTYLKSLIEDYIVFIKNVDELAEIWQKDNKNNPFFAKSADLKGLEKLSDLYVKIQFSSYCIKLQEKIKNDIKDVVVYDQDTTVPTTLDKNKLYIFVGWEYSSNGHEGVLDVAIPVEYDNGGKPTIRYGCRSSDLLIKIQVEGISYRHVLEQNNNQLNLINIGTSTPYTSLGWFADLTKSDSGKVDFGNNDIFGTVLYPQRKVKYWPFKSYKSNFIYQEKKITKNIQVDAVLDNIVQEIQRVINAFKK